MEDERSERPRNVSSDPGRIRRESRSESAIGAEIRKAALEAESRVLRQRGYPPPTVAEQALIGASLHQPVQLFSRVLLAELEGGEPEQYTLVPHDEADLGAGRISIGSPLGRALFQEYPGAVVRVKTPGGERLCRILQVNS